MKPNKIKLILTMLKEDKITIEEAETLFEEIVPKNTFTFTMPSVEYTVKYSPYLPYNSNTGTIFSPYNQNNF